MTTRKRCNHEHLIQHTCIRSTDVVSGLYLRSVRFRGGSSRCDVEEVDVLGSSWEVVVHGVVEVVVHVATVVEVDVHGISAGRRVAVHVRRGTRFEVVHIR